MTDEQLILLAHRAQVDPKSLTESEIQELCLATMEPLVPNKNFLMN